MKFSIVAIVAPSAVFGLVPPMSPPMMHSTAAQDIPIIRTSLLISTPSTMISEAAPKSAIAIDDALYKNLEKETRAVEKLAKKDERKAKVEKSREAFFDYESKMASVQEARIEEAEQRAIDEAIKDKKEFERIKALEAKVEKEAETAETKAEKDRRLKLAQKLLKEEKELLRKEKAAERKEKVFLAEEIQEQKILKQKQEAAKAEQAKYEKIEKEYERVEQEALEDELELRLAKKFSEKK